MKNSLIYFILAIFFIGCKKDIKEDAVLINFKLSQNEFFADGQSTVSLSVILSEKSSADRRSVIFTTSAGTFTSTGSNKYTSKAEFENGVLIAKAVLKSSTQPGTIKVSVQPEFDSPLKEFTIIDSIIAKPSIPVSVKLEPSSYGIGANFSNEIFLTATLKNSFGKFVSKGYNVLFEDFIQNGNPANGHFRNFSGATRDSSKVTGYYSAFNYPIGTQLKIRSTLLDANGIRTSISDSIFLSINQ